LKTPIIFTLRPLRLGEEKKIEERNYRMKILWSALLHRATIIIKNTFY